jgi:hypothetical protein
MSLHISRFIDRLKSFEARGQRDFSMPMQDARDLHADITKLLMKLEQQTEAIKQEPLQIEVVAPKF